MKGAGLSGGSLINIPSLKIQLGLESIGIIIEGKSNKHVSADVMEIFVDSLNCWMMKKVRSNYPDVYVITSGDTFQLSKVVQVYT